MPIHALYAPATARTVRAQQAMPGLPQDGVVGLQTWEALYRIYVGITDTVAQYTNVIPPAYRPELDDEVPAWLTQFPGQPLSLGDADTRGGNS